jgi:P-type Ca2+ transporter type 2C
MPADPSNDPTLSPAPAPYRLAADEVAAALRVDVAQGLSAAEALRRLDQHGFNLIATQRPTGLLRHIARQFASLMIGVLLAAAAVAGAMGEVLNAVVILVIVLLNAAIGAAQAWRADRAMRALQHLVTPQSTVRRDGQVQSVATADLVTGDVVLLSAGECVPADLRLVDAQRLRIDESMLTGESVGIDKVTATLPPGTAPLPLGDRVNLAHKGTHVTQGRGTGVVVATGAHTELGRIATLLNAAPERDTPLQRRLATLARQLAVAVLVICAAIFALGLWRGEPLGLMALTAISLAVAAMPEALPAVVAVLLAFGARRMARAHALVRHLPAVETLGAVDRICADKTGTLTLNRMSVACALTSPDGPALTVSTRAWDDVHDEAANADLDTATATDPPSSRTASVALWRAALLCNDAQAYPPSPDSDALLWQGDPTETALLEGAQAVGLHVHRWRLRMQRQHEWPFDAERRRMSTLHRSSAGWLLVCKGAPETVLPRCHTYQQVPDDAGRTLHQAWQARADALAAQGLRVLAVAQRRWPPAGTGAPARPHELDSAQAEDGLELLGLIGLIDPPRPEAAAAVAQCRHAGITPVMITGDHPATALAIARALGIVGTADITDAVLTGAELAPLDEAAFSDRVSRARVFARVDPAQKIRIVQALQARGHVVAMTGDGVNDAPALKAADIGVAMGRGGTDVAREAASLVLLDDHFATIVAAVREGRRIVDNIRRFLRYALTGNSGELWTLVLAPLLGLPLPLVPVQILWINLITDGLPGLALAAEPAEPGVMQRPPRRPDQGLLDGGLWQHALGVGLLIGLLCVALQVWATHNGHPGQTLVFTALTLCQLGHALAIRSDTVPLWRLNPLRNRSLAGAVALSAALLGAVIYLPPLQAVFQTQALNLAELGLCLACAAVVMAAVEVEKAMRRRRLARTVAATAEAMSTAAT